MTTTPPNAGYKKVSMPATGFMMNVVIDLLLLIISIAPTFKIGCALVRFGFFRNSQNVLLYYITMANVSASLPATRNKRILTLFFEVKKVAVAQTESLGKDTMEDTMEQDTSY
jgi:hypothetical protein